VSSVSHDRRHFNSVADPERECGGCAQMLKQKYFIFYIIISTICLRKSFDLFPDKFNLSTNIHFGG